MTVFKKALAAPQLHALADQGVVSAATFLTLLFIGRQLPPGEFGLFSLAMMGMLFLANMHRALLTQPLNILGAGEHGAQLAQRLLGLLRTHLIAIPLAFAFLALLSRHFFPQNALLVACAAYVGCFFLQETLRRYWYTTGQIHHALRNDVLGYGGQILVLVVAAYFWNIDGTTAFALMATASLTAFLVGLHGIALPAGTSPLPMRTLVAQHRTLSGWLMLTVLAVWGASQIYPFLLSPLGAVAVASFAACRNLLNATGVVVQSVGNYLPVRAATLLRLNGKSALRRHLFRTLVQSAAFGALFVVAVLLSAEALMHVLYGGLYDAAAPILRILAVGTFFSLMGAVLGAYSLAMEDPRASFLANLGASAFTFTIGLWLIQAHGLAGAAIATTLSLAVSMVIQGALVLVRLQNLPSATRRRASADVGQEEAAHG